MVSFLPGFGQNKSIVKTNFEIKRLFYNEDHKNTLHCFNTVFRLLFLTGFLGKVMTGNELSPLISIGLINSA